MTKFFTIDDVDIIDLDKLARLLPGGASWVPWSVRGRYISAMLRSWSVLKAHGVASPLQLAHFIGQGLVETGFLQYTAENLNYSTDGLRKVFPGYYPTKELAAAEARQPARIAERVYGGRMGNRTPGDGWLYRGRGFLQITGRDNYAAYAEASGLDIVADPDLLTKDLSASIRVAAAFWKANKLGPYAERDDAAAVSRGVNRGNPEATRPARHEADRILWTKRVLSLLTKPARALYADVLNRPRPLSLGDEGDEVAAFQKALVVLDFLRSPLLGVFDVATLRALVAFQSENDLATSGEFDQATVAALDVALADARGYAAASKESKQLKRGGGGRKASDRG